MWALELRSPISNTAESASNKYTGKSGLAGKLSYDLGHDSALWFDIDGGGANVEQAGVSKIDAVKTVTNLGYSNHLIRNNEVMVFYEIKYRTTSESEKVNDVKKDKTELPVLLGVESEANSWMTLRASLTQNILIGSSKDTSIGAEADTITPNTSASAGAGFKWGKNNFDVTLNTSADGKFGFDSTGFAANAGYTYLF